MAISTYVCAIRNLRLQASGIMCCQALACLYSTPLMTRLSPSHVQ